MNIPNEHIIFHMAYFACGKNNMERVYLKRIFRIIAVRLGYYGFLVQNISWLLTIITLMFHRFNFLSAIWLYNNHIQLMATTIGIHRKKRKILNKNGFCTKIEPCGFSLHLVLYRHQGIFVVHHRKQDYNYYNSKTIQNNFIFTEIQQEK